ncbi:MAG: hypothetical protein K0R75_1742 [Paenibacillaceae bacterium]|jgi:hypothetical protein|nr:hypothetical protein [Paenibacillaceae bacterium]
MMGHTTKAQPLKWFIVFLAFSMLVACTGNTSGTNSANGKEQTGESVSKSANNEIAYMSTEPVRLKAWKRTLPDWRQEPK